MEVIFALVAAIGTRACTFMENDLNLNNVRNFQPYWRRLHGVCILYF